MGTAGYGATARGRGGQTMGHGLRSDVHRSTDSVVPVSTWTGRSSTAFTSMSSPGGKALSAIGIDLSVWRIHRRIGMSGGLFVSALLRETGLSAVPGRHRRAAAGRTRRSTVRRWTRSRRLPLARANCSRAHRGGRAVADRDSGYAATARPALALLGLPEDTPMVTRDLVRHPNPTRPVPGRRGRARGGAAARDGRRRQRLGPARGPASRDGSASG